MSPRISLIFWVRALPVLKHSGSWLEMEQGPLVPNMSPDNSFLVQALSTHFTELETEVWRGKQAAQGKWFTSTCSPELLLI